MSLTTPSPSPAPQGLTDSRLALYQALIALAWADHTLHAAERAQLHEMIDGNLHATPEQKASLHDQIDRPQPLAAIWPRLTDVQDRARLVDWSHCLFAADGDVDALEERVGETLLRDHLATLDEGRISADLEALRDGQAAADRQEIEDLRNYRKQYSLAASIGRLFGR